MSTSNLHQTASHPSTPSLTSSFAVVSVPPHGVLAFLRKALQRPVLERQEPSEQTSRVVPFVYTPIRFSWGSMFTPPQEGDGFR